MKRFGFCALIALMMTVVGCEPPAEEENNDRPKGLHSIKVDASRPYALEQGGEIRVAFTVEDADVVFLGVSDYEVLLRKAGSTQSPTEVAIARVVNGSKAGEYEAIVADCSGAEVYSLSVTLDIKNNTTGTVCKSNKFVVMRSMSLSTGVPVMVINTVGGVPVVDKENWRAARISIDGLGQFESLEECDVEIRGRGNSTWEFDKKPYALKFPSKTSVLGMPKHKRWVLLANTMDRTMMRNRVAYRVAEQTSLAWTPRTEYVEVVLNGEHIGNYLLAEQIRIDKNRINITEMDATDTSGDAVTGGYVYEMDFHFDNVNQWWTPQGFPSSIKFPDEEDIVPAQIEWGKNYFNEVEGVLFGSNFKSPTEGYAKYIDAQSFVDYWLVYEICINHELANPGSVYMHKDRGGKLTAGPIWDFDWGTFAYKASPQARGKLFMMGAIWYRRLFEDPAFKQLAKERWQALYPKFKAIEDFIEEQYAYLGESAKLNFAIWDPTTTGNISGLANGDEHLSFDEAYRRFYDFYVDRIETMNSIFATW